MYFRHISTGGSVTNFTGLLNSVLQKSANRTDYLQCMTQILNQVTVDTLPIGLRSLWEDLPVGFHSHEIAKVPISDLPKANVYLVLKAYLFSLDSAPGKQGAVAIVPHEHVGIPTQIEDRFHQAITYALAAEGNLEIVENRFEHIANGKVKHSTARPRELRSIGYDNHAAEIHNFEAISFGGRAKAIVLAAYITAKNPDIYFQESIDTAERSAQLIRLIENGFTPYRPTTNFSDPFVLSPDLTLPKEAVEVLESVSLTALQQRVSTQWQWLNREIESHTISKFDLDATGASTVALSLNPFLRALSTGDITPVIVSRKPETCSCEDSTLFRLNYGTLTAG
ncbi:hypothetical protein EBR57_07010, partial [bacterium]|nr:hypothetical protein [bacterium]